MSGPRQRAAEDGRLALASLHHQERRLWLRLALFSLLNTTLLLLLLSLLASWPLSRPLPQAAAYLLLVALIVLGAVAHLRFLGQRKGLDSQWRRRAAGALEEAAEEEQRIRDPLTGLYTRRFFDEFVAAEMRRAQRTGTDLSLMLLDIVGFREMNERLGHLAADQALQAAADALKDSVRASDAVFRFGGDEFALVLLGTPYRAAEAMRGRLLQRVAEHPRSRQLPQGPLQMQAVAVPCARSADVDGLVEAALGHLEAGAGALSPAAAPPPG
jgi:diguanylate cyclase (GGDEF)-like protein